MDTIDVTVQQAVDASIERAFDAWLEPASARRFLFATEHGEMVRAEIDPRVGGAFNFTERRDGREVEHVGRYVAIERPRRLAFDFSVPAFSKDETRVDLAFEPGRVTLTHRMPASQAEWREKTEAGWRTILANFARVLREPAAPSG